MSTRPEHEFNVRLLDLHLGHLSQGEQAELRQQIAADPVLAAQDAALARVFVALRSARIAPAAPDLAARVSARVRAAGAPPRVVRPADRLTDEVEARNERVIRLGGLRDVIAVAALLVLAVGVGVPGLLNMRERGERLGCTRNLQMLGAGMQQYANSFNASLPFAGFNGTANSWQPSDDPRVTTIPNRQHVYILLQRNFVRDPMVFVCPGQSDVPMPIAAVGRSNDFLETRNVSYAYQNMAGVRPATGRDDPSLPVLSDDNPLFANGLPLVDVRRLPWTDRARLNSRAHHGAGQNLLSLSGEVKWVTTPFAGVNGDNIWTLQNVTDYTGHEGPASSGDSHLLK